MDRYLVKRKIGEGSFSEVFQAETANGNGCAIKQFDVAIKILKEVLSKQNKVFCDKEALSKQKLFENKEVFALKILQRVAVHPNIIKLLDCKQQNGLSLTHWFLL